MDNFDYGARLFDAAGTYPAHKLTSNVFTRCVQAVTLTGGVNGPFRPTVSCNLISDGDYGIFIDRNADVGDIGTPQEPCGNDYRNIVADAVSNDGANLITYTAQQSPRENIASVRGATGGILNSVSGNNCSQRGATHGLRNAPGTAATATDALQWQEQVRENTLSPIELHALEEPLAAYYEQAGQLGELESFVQQLPLSNPVAFARLGLYLLQTYRNAGQEGDAQRVQQLLAGQQGGSREMATRLAYFDLAARLFKLGLGQRPSPADSSALVNIASSGTDYAPVACTTLRYYYPALNCSAGSAAGGQPVARFASVLTTAKNAPLSLWAYPNPATAKVTVHITGAVPDKARLELVEVATGRVVHTATLGGNEWHASVAELAAGVYVARLLHQQQLLRVTKVVVIH